MLLDKTFSSFFSEWPLVKEQKKGLGSPERLKTIFYVKILNR